MTRHRSSLTNMIITGRGGCYVRSWRESAIALLMSEAPRILTPMHELIDLNEITDRSSGDPLIQWQCACGRKGSGARTQQEAVKGFRRHAGVRRTTRTATSRRNTNLLGW